MDEYFFRLSCLTLLTFKKIAQKNMTPSWVLKVPQGTFFVLWAHRNAKPQPSGCFDKGWLGQVAWLCTIFEHLECLWMTIEASWTCICLRKWIKFDSRDTSTNCSSHNLLLKSVFQQSSALFRRWCWQDPCLVLKFLTSKVYSVHQATQFLLAEKCTWTDWTICHLSSKAFQHTKK